MPGSVAEYTAGNVEGKLSFCDFCGTGCAITAPVDCEEYSNAFVKYICLNVYNFKNGGVWEHFEIREVVLNFVHDKALTFLSQTLQAKCHRDRLYDICSR